MELRKPWSAAGIWSHAHCQGRTCHDPAHAHVAHLGKGDLLRRLGQGLSIARQSGLGTGPTVHIPKN